MVSAALLWVALCFLGLQARATWIAYQWLTGVIPLGDATGRPSDSERI
jgi:hypothetical protein